ncbi:CCA-adding enzyme [uncultured archaeon]|nr:CCA-adding enzyme [uncultured archaeon]
MKCMHPDRAEKVFASVLKKIKPTESQNRKDFEAANHLIKKLSAVVPSSIEVKLGGSLAKGTNLAGHNEFDIFVLFPQSMKHDEMTTLGMQYARKAFAGMRMETRYAEHPYLQVYHGDYHADIVPAYRITAISEKGSSVDRSQLHTSYINSKLDAKGKDGVRLLKRFMKNFGIYGAELRVEGFSGYLCELLVAHYGSLISAMEAASEWHEPVLDTEQHGAPLSEMRKMFPAPLIVIDPVDPKRNVAAVVSRTSLSRFIFECRRFLRGPSEKFFYSEKKQHTLSEVKRMMEGRRTKCLLVSFKAPEVVPDILWPQLRKTAGALSKHLTDRDLSVFGQYHWSDGEECAVFFELDKWEMPSVVKAMGPSVTFAADADAFVEKHSGALNMHIEHERIVAVEKREVTDAATALSEACRKPQGLGVPHRMEEAIRKGKILEGKALLKEKYREFLSDYFFAKI